MVVLIFGLVVDYCLFLSAAISQSHPEDEQSVFRTMSAVLVSALTTLAGMGALALAGHPGLHALGLTALIGIATGLILVMLMIPLLVKKGQNPLSEEV
ncbi:MMPL family transporter [bacterium]|nr:MMPL family transporter [bacterium]